MGLKTASLQFEEAPSLHQELSGPIIIGPAVHPSLSPSAAAVADAVVHASNATGVEADAVHADISAADNVFILKLCLIFLYLLFILRPPRFLSLFLS